MAVKASAETIREMKKQITQTIKDFERIEQNIRTGIRATDSWDWNDDKAAEFNIIMQRVARLTASPVETLSAALPKLEKLAQLLDAYNSKKIGK